MSDYFDVTTDYLLKGMGLIIMAMGCMIFAVGQSIGSRQNIDRVRRSVLLINAWVLTFIPFACCFNLADGWFGGYRGLLASYPLRGNSILTYAFGWLVYLTIGVAMDVLLMRNAKEDKRR